MPALPAFQAKGLDAQVRAALYNIDHFDKAPHQDKVPTVVLSDGRKIEARLPSETARERGQVFLDRVPEEAVREAERRYPRNAIYSLKRIGPAMPGTPRELFGVIVGYGFERGSARCNFTCLGFPAWMHAKGQLGSSTNPIPVPVDAEFEDVTDIARNAGAEWARRTFAFRSWLATLNP